MVETVSNHACIACGRTFSPEQIAQAIDRRAARIDPILLEYPAENARDYPLCEDHGLRHLRTPETASVFKASYFDGADGAEDDQDDDVDWDEIDQENTRMKQAEAALRAAQNRLYFGNKAKRRKRR